MVRSGRRASIVFLVLAILSLFASGSLAWDGPEVVIETPESGAVHGDTDLTVSGTATGGSMAMWSEDSRDDFAGGQFVDTAVDENGIALSAGGITPKFGGCAEAGGPDSYIAYSGFSFQLGSAATIELWMYYEQLPPDDALVFEAIRFSGSSRYITSILTFRSKYDSLAFCIITTDGIWRPIRAPVPSAGSWHHISCSYGAEGLTISIDGQVWVRGGITQGGHSWNGLSLGHHATVNPRDTAKIFVDEVRVSTGQRYTSNFTPPAAPFTSDSRTKLLDHLDGSTSGTNNGWTLWTITREGHYISKAHDTGAEIVHLHRAGWDAQAPSGTSLRVKLRSSPNPDMSGASDWILLSKGDLGGTDVNRYLQYRVELERTSATTPRFKAFRLTYGGVTEVLVSLDGEEWTTAEGTTSWSAEIEVPEGIVTVTVLARDVAGNITVSHVTVVVDLTPPIGYIVLAGGRTYVKEGQVDVRVVAQDDVSIVEMMVSEDPSFLDAEWESFQESFVYNFGDREGERRIYVKVRNLGGLESSVMTDTVILDMTPPTGVLVVGDGSGISTKRAVELTLAVTDENGVTSMRIGNPLDIQDRPWAAFREVASWDLGTLEGLCEVMVEVSDAAGNVLPLLGEVVLDLEAPTVEVVIAGGTDLVSERSVLVKVTAHDTIGVASMRCAASLDSIKDALWVPFNTSYILDLGQLDVAHWEFVEVMDVAGRTAIASDAITLDMTPPTGSLVIAGGAEWVNDHNVTLTIDAEDATSGVVYIRVSNSPSFTGALEMGPVPSMEWTLADGDGERAVWLEVVDRAGYSTVVNDTIVVCSVPPTGSIRVRGDSVKERSVTVELVWDQAVEMLVSEDPYVTGPWVPVEALITYTLSEGDGPKTLYARFRGQYDLFSETYQDQVILDTVAPSVVIITPEPGQLLRSRSLTVTGIVTDDGIITSLTVQMDGGEPRELTPSESWSTSMNLEIWGDHTVKVWAMDKSGNLGEASVVFTTREHVEHTVVEGNLLLLLVIIAICLTAIIGIYLMRPRGEATPPSSEEDARPPT